MRRLQPQFPQPEPGRALGNSWEFNFSVILLSPIPMILDAEVCITEMRLNTDSNKPIAAQPRSLSLAPFSGFAARSAVRRGALFNGLIQHL